MNRLRLRNFLLRSAAAAGAGGPAFSWDFTRTNSLPPGAAVTRSGNGTFLDNTGTRRTAGTDVARFDHTSAGVPRGLRLEAQKTNYLLNSTSPATQTTGALSTGTYTLWVEGSGSAAVSAGSATITGGGSASAGSPRTFTVTVGGTVTVTVTGSLTAFQLENGSTDTSLIVTAGSAGVRNAEYLSMTSILWFNQSEGTFLLDFEIPNPTLFPSDFNVALMVSKATGTLWNDSHIIYGRTAGRIDPQTYVGGSGVATLQHAASAGRRKIAYAYRANDFASTLDASAMQTDTAGALPTVARLQLGYDGLGSGAAGGAFTAWYRSFVYYPRRLSNAEMQRLTA